MDELVKIIEEMGIPFAYDHFAEGESPDPPFCVTCCRAAITSQPMAGFITK